MTQNGPASYSIFLIASVTTVFVSTVAILWSGYGFVLVLVLVSMLLFTGIGVYRSLTYKTNESKSNKLNRIGLIGNLAIFLFVVIIMMLAAVGLS
jgi:hypothetical protein